MSTMQIDVLESLLKQARELAAEDDVTLEQLISSALAEKMSALKTISYLEKRAARGDRARFNHVLSRVPDVEPDAQNKF